MVLVAIESQISGLIVLFFYFIYSQLTTGNFGRIQDYRQVHGAFAMDQGDSTFHDVEHAKIPATDIYTLEDSLLNFLRSQQAATARVDKCTSDNTQKKTYQG